MKTDLKGSIKRVAKFLDIAIAPEILPRIVEHCSFEYMKAHASEVAPRGGMMWKGGATTFINKGSNGRWRDALSAEEVAAYDTKSRAELGAECADWLGQGGEIKN